MKKYIVFSLFWVVSVASAQINDSITLNFKEYLGYVKKYHPIAKQAELSIGIGQANLMKARGGFDPKIEVDYSNKVFKNTDYYDLLNATFKIPTWYGIELKANYENNSGDYLNPQNKVPDDGLFSMGVSVSVLQGLLINDRMASLKRAKIFKQQSLAERDMLVNQILYDASLAYFDWVQAFNEVKIYSHFLKNAQVRFDGVKQSAFAGDKASIDTVEAKIILNNRALGLEQSKIELLKSSLELSNFLWLENNIPVELQENVIPDVYIASEIDSVLEISGQPLSEFTTENHPKLRSLNFKIESLEVDKRLKANKLLPKVDLQYNFLTETPDYINTYTNDSYKSSVNILFPLFLRKERGDLKLAKFKLQDAQFEFDNTQVAIKNKVLSIYKELESFDKQLDLIENVVIDYNTLLKAEERKFSFGESSLFLINSREKSFIEAKLKQNSLQNKYYVVKAKLFNSLSNNPSVF
jgi:outer membrane protein TolC